MKLTRGELRLNYNEACNAYLMAFYEKLRERREKEPDKVHGKDPKMKNQVKFVKMTIIELNKVNFRDALKIFAQGRQADGHALDILPRLKPRDS